jgi:DNA-directed RNA polymerase subunit RPC12/RpoP
MPSESATGRKYVERKMYPGYVFIEMELEEDGRIDVQPGTEGLNEHEKGLKIACPYCDDHPMLREKVPLLRRLHCGVPCQRPRAQGDIHRHLAERLHSLRRLREVLPRRGHNAPCQETGAEAR